MDHERSAIVWAAPGKSADTLRSFFSDLGAGRTSLLESVTIDMSAAYVTAVTEAAPKASLVFDRFHVHRLAHDALDQVRREQARAVTDKDERRALKNTRFALQKNPWNLTADESAKLADVERTNAPIYKARRSRRSRKD